MERREEKKKKVRKRGRKERINCRSGIEEIVEEESDERNVKSKSGASRKRVMMEKKERKKRSERKKEEKREKERKRV